MRDNFIIQNIHGFNMRIFSCRTGSAKICSVASAVLYNLWLRGRSCRPGRFCRTFSSTRNTGLLGIILVPSQRGKAL